jgi:hypothetical protein
MLRNILVVMVFGTAAVIGVWDLLQIQAFDNALMQFATAGIIPGTHAVLSPGQMYTLLCVILLLVICLTFRTSLVRDWREFRRTAFSRGRRTMERTPSTLAMTPPEPIAQVAAAKASQQPQPMFGLTPVPPSLNPEAPVAAQQSASKQPASSRPAVIITIPATPGVLVRYARVFRQWLRPASARAWRRFIIRGRQDSRQLAACARRSARWVIKQTITAWHHTEPYIHEWDNRIEQRIKRNPAAAQVIREVDRIHRRMVERVVGWRARGQHPVEK